MESAGMRMALSVSLILDRPDSSSCANAIISLALLQREEQERLREERAPKINAARMKIETELSRLSLSRSLLPSESISYTYCTLDNPFSAIDGALHSYCEGHISLTSYIPRERYAAALFRLTVPSPEGDY